MHYNFARPHTTLSKPYPTTPTMAAGVTDQVIGGRAILGHKAAKSPAVVDFGENPHEVRPYDHFEVTQHGGGGASITGRPESRRPESPR